MHGSRKRPRVRLLQLGIQLGHPGLQLRLGFSVRLHLCRPRITVSAVRIPSAAWRAAGRTCASAADACATAERS